MPVNQVILTGVPVHQVCVDSLKKYDFSTNKQAVSGHLGQRAGVQIQCRRSGNLL